MSKFAYPATFEPDEAGRPVVSFMDFGRAHTDGKNDQEAFEEAMDLLGGLISNLIVKREAIPAPSRLERGQRLVPVPFWIAGKLALYVALREQGVSNSELARRLGVRETVVRRMLDPNRATKPEKLQAALEALGKHLAVGLEDAA